MCGGHFDIPDIFVTKGVNRFIQKRMSGQGHTINRRCDQLEQEGFLIIVLLPDNR